MASAANPRDGGGGPAGHISSFLRTVSTRISSFLNPKPPSPPRIYLKIHHFLLPNSQLSLATPSDSAQSDTLSSNPSGNTASSSSSSVESVPSSEPGLEFPSGTRISTAKGGEPAFVGHVYSICDDSGSDIMDVSTHFNIPFLPKRTPEWLKEMFAAVTKSDRSGYVYRFFMDIGDAVSYLQHNIPNGVVGEYSLDTAYELFKENPDLVQFVPNERQVKEANKLLKTVSRGNGKKKVDGVPVFSSQNLDIVIATTNGIRRYTPYFFDKNFLDGILEASADQYFQSLIQKRHLQRRGDDGDGDVVDYNLTNEVAEAMRENIREVEEAWDEVLDEMGHPDISLNLISKAVEVEILYAVDKVLLGNRWLRKAIGIQPKFPYMVDSFEKKSASSFLGANNKPSVKIADTEFDNAHDKQAQIPDFQFPFGDWLTHPWLNKWQKQYTRRQEEVKPSPFLPKITIVDISTGEPQTSNASLRKTTDDLMKELEQENRSDGPTWTESMVDERDPLFVADVETLSACYI